MLAANHVINCKKIVSPEIGILSKLVKLPLLNHDPSIRGYGIWPCDTSSFSREKFGGRSSGCGTSWDEALLGFSYNSHGLALKLCNFNIFIPLFMKQNVFCFNTLPWTMRKPPCYSQLTWF